MDASKYTLDGLPIIQPEAGESIVNGIEELKDDLRDYLYTKLKLIKDENSVLEEIISRVANNKKTMNKEEVLLGAIMVYELMRKQMIQNNVDDVTTHSDDAGIF